MAANDCLIVTLAAKVKGHAGLIRADQDDTLEQVKTHRHHLTYSKMPKHHGWIDNATIAPTPGTMIQNVHQSRDTPML